MIRNFSSTKGTKITVKKDLLGWANGAVQTLFAHNLGGPVSDLGLFDYIDEYLASDFVAQDNGGLLAFDQQAQIIVKGGVI